MWERVIVSRFVRNSVWIAAANAVSQGMLAAVAPLLTRLYSPADFGTAALFLALVQTLAPFVDGRLSLVIPLPKYDVEAVQVGVAALALNFAICTVGQILLSIWGSQLSLRWESERLTAWLWLVPSTLAMSCAYQSMRMWGIRQRRFGTVATSTICRASFYASVPILFVFIWPIYRSSEAGLLVALVASDIVGTTFLLLGLRSDRRLWKRISLSRIRSALRPYRNTILTILSSQALSATYIQIPVFTIGLFFGPTQLGLYFLAERFASLPSQIIGRAFGDVYRQRAAQIWHTGESLYPLALRATLFLTLLGGPFYAIAAIFAPSIFAIVFGEAWRDAGTLASLLVLSRFLQFVSSGVESTSVIIGATRYIFAWYAARGFVFLTISCVQHYYSFSFLVIVALFSAAEALMWAVDVFVVLRIAKRQKR